MNRIYIAIALMTLYGDLLKRYMSDSGSLGTLYLLACIILLAMKFQANKKKAPLCREAKTMKFFVFSLIILYFLQLLVFSFDELFPLAFTHTLYMCVPLMYIIVILKFFPQFDLVKLSQGFLIMMIPIKIENFH